MSFARNEHEVARSRFCNGLFYCPSAIGFNDVRGIPQTGQNIGNDGIGVFGARIV